MQQNHRGVNCRHSRRSPRPKPPPSRSSQASATVAIPKEHHRFVIGKNGEKLQELELKTATKIAIPRPDDPSANIRITGTKEGIEKARHEILLIAAEQVSRVVLRAGDIDAAEFTRIPILPLPFPPAPQDKRAVERLSLEKAFHPFIAGAHNRQVQELSQETGARISIPPPSLPKDEIVITGEKEAVAMALSRIRAIYDDKVRLMGKGGRSLRRAQSIGLSGWTIDEGTCRVCDWSIDHLRSGPALVLGIVSF